jgi:hypothetical protein
MSISSTVLIPVQWCTVQFYIAGQNKPSLSWIQWTGSISFVGSMIKSSAPNAILRLDLMVITWYCRTNHLAINLEHHWLKCASARDVDHLCVMTRDHLKIIPPVLCVTFQNKCPDQIVYRWPGKCYLAELILPIDYIEYSPYGYMPGNNHCCFIFVEYQVG